MEDLIEHFKVREMIECYAIDIFKEKKINSLPQLTSCVEKTLGIIIPSPDDPPKNKLHYIEKLAEFHFKLIESTDNELLFQFYKAIYSNINRYVYANGFAKGILQHRAADHKLILEYIEICFR